MVSIYMLRKERDHLRSRKSTSTRYCNPRARKERDLTSAELYANTSTFQSTCSARSATNVYFRGSLFIKFQSTRSARSATPPTIAARGSSSFNPRAPQGARPRSRQTSATNAAFQSTRSARSATATSEPPAARSSISIHALRKERDVGSTTR